MPIIFVHGVNNRREDKAYEPNRLLTKGFLEEYFQNLLIDGHTLSTVHTHFPYWGHLATKFAWGMKSLPSGRLDSLGSLSNVDEEISPLVNKIGDLLNYCDEVREFPLLAISRKSFSVAIDIVTELLLQSLSSNEPKAVVEFIISAQRYAEQFKNVPPLWLEQISTDEQFISFLVNGSRPAKVITSLQSMGVTDTIYDILYEQAFKLKVSLSMAAEEIVDLAGDYASKKFLTCNRGALNKTFGRFFGDVFIYLDGRGTQSNPGVIPKHIISEWNKAITEAPVKDPLIVIGHSLGGVISYDLLSHFSSDLTVDLFITVGSQVSHFEEMKLFMSSDKTIPGHHAQRASKPANIKQWINVLDEVDIFSYSCESVFDDVVDFHYDTNTYIGKAHLAYFKQARFYMSLRSKIEELAKS